MPVKRHLAQETNKKGNPMKVSKKTEERIASTVPKFQKVLAVAKARDLNESDTVVIITDILTEVFGYEKYLEVTSELAIRGTYCDLAVKIGDKFQFLIECKAVGTDLKDVHLRQAVGYGANKGIQWIVLTNGIDWQLYRLRFEQPIAWDLVDRFDLLSGSIKDQRFFDSLLLLSREGVEKGARDDLYEKIQCVNRFVIGNILLSDQIVSTVRRELRKLADGIRIEDDEIIALIRDGVLRRDLVEGEEAAAATAKFAKLCKSVAAPIPKPRPMPKPDARQPAADPQTTPSSDPAVIADTPDSSSTL
jgi:predicted type IV restriction endonuclease